ncbi:RNA polymerase subunit sigma-70 [Streptosporangium sp. NBC_01495]|uniref:RNA polymerase subunit sigma-70 n=1 Tax=Streptosporangium sp. NBC_01495 TaxID=2903899 RepID=UPI002E36A440|nr:RNA polymerase subunit sigma-70 [Streptosporangium sp. NBC_01495]
MHDVYLDREAGSMTITAMPDRDFARMTDTYRRELLVHCARMLGSAEEAEDLVQETYLRAWRSYRDFEGRSSVRTWLYRIATNVCLTALDARGRRPLPTGLDGQPAVTRSPRTPAEESAWLEPMGTVVFGVEPVNPAAMVQSRASVRLALAAALRHLSPRQRAVLILREVLDFRAVEVAEMLETSSVAVNSMLQRARARLSAAALTPDHIGEPGSGCERDVLDRYVAAFEKGDLAALTRLLTTDVVCELPPDPDTLAGRDAIIRYLATECPAFGACKLVRTSYKGRPAFATYVRGDDGVYRPYSLDVLTITGPGVSRIESLQDPALLSTLTSTRLGRA